jgi:hypothetical protein
VRVIARTWSRLRLDWEIGLHRLPFFTQKVAVVLLGALVASLALLGGVTSLVGPPGGDGPDRLVPGDSGGSPATARPAPAQTGGQGAGDGQGAGGAATPAPVGAPALVPAGASASGRAPAGSRAAPGAAGAGGGTPAAPPTTTASTTTTTGQGGLPPLEDVVSSVVSTLLP